MQSFLIEKFNLLFTVKVSNIAEKSNLIEAKIKIYFNKREKHILKLNDRGCADNRIFNINSLLL